MISAAQRPAVTDDAGTPDDVGLVDAHHHLWDLGANPRYPWLVGPAVPTHFGDYAALRRNYTIDDYLHDAVPAGVVKSVHCEAGWDRTDPAGETRWLQAVADRHGFPHGIVGYVDLSSEHAEATLDAHREQVNFRGVRQTLFSPTELQSGDLRGAERIRSSRWRRGLGLLRNPGLIFDLQVVPSIMRDAAALARDFDDLVFVITHTGLPLDRTAPGRAAWRSGMQLLAACGNVYVKISGLPMGDWQWTAASLRPWVQMTLELFGPDRCMLGSNFPVDGLHARYGTLMRAYLSVVDELSIDERRSVRTATAERVYRL